MTCRDFHLLIQHISSYLRFGIIFMLWECPKMRISSRWPISQSVKLRSKRNPIILGIQFHYDLQGKSNVYRIIKMLDYICISYNLILVGCD